MKFIFYNRDFGKWLYRFLDERDVQEQIKKQWENNSSDIELNASKENGVLIPYASFEDVSVRLIFSKNDVAPSFEYKPNEWNCFPQVIPPEKGRYLVTVKYCNGEIQTEMDWYHPASNSWNTEGPHEVIAFRGLPNPYKLKKDEGEDNDNI